MWGPDKGQLDRMAICPSFGTRRLGPGGQATSELWQDLPGER